MNGPSVEMVERFPYSRESELCVLSCAMQNPPLLDLFGDDDGLFYVPAHATVMQAFRNVAGRGDLVSWPTVAAWLTDQGKLENVGGHGFIASLLDFSPGFDERTMLWHLDRVREFRLRRNLITEASEIISSAGDQSIPVTEVVADAETKILAVCTAGATNSTHTTALEAARSYIDRVEKIVTGEILPGIPTGFVWLDGMIKGGLQAGEYYVIAARPGKGKTALALNVLLHIARAIKERVGIFSLEMAPEQLGGRALSELGRVNLHDLEEGGGVAAHSLEGLLRGCIELQNAATIFVDKRARITPDEIRSTARRWVRKFGVKVIALDYIQRISAGSSAARRDERIRVQEGSAALAEVAKELGIPVIGLAQLNREPGDNEPSLHHLKSAGDLEQDAHVVAMLWKYGDHPHNAGTELIGLKLAKNRNGKTGSTVLRFNPHFTEFEKESARKDEIERANETWEM